MTVDWGAVNVTRPTYRGSDMRDYGPSSLEYRVNLSSGQVTVGDLFTHSFRLEDVPRIYGRKASEALQEQLDLPRLTIASLSNDGKKLAAFTLGHQLINIIDLQSGKATEFKVSFDPLREGGTPEWLCWSHDDSKLFFGVGESKPAIGVVWDTYYLDLLSGQEVKLTHNREVRFASP